jgi:hypothetical protein
VLITSERDGWKQLYLLDLKDKSLKPLTNGAYYINQVLHVDKAKGFILPTTDVAAATGLTLPGGTN